MKDENPISWDDLDDLLAESKAMAHGLLLLERSASLQCTDLVLTALRRLRHPDQDWSEVHWASRKYFFGALYKSMQRALIDHARRRTAHKRRGEVRLDPEEFVRVLEKHAVMTSLEQQPAIVEALMNAMENLRDEEPDWVAMIEHRFFSGLTLAETAQMMNVSVKTIQRWWTRARLVLHERVSEQLAD